ncbi:MAG: hypothetical protein R2847_06410 [Bacteroidia bacterium]
MKYASASAITGFTKRLLNTSATSEQKQYIRTIDMAGDHLLNIVNDVLVYRVLKQVNYS